MIVQTARNDVEVATINPASGETELNLFFEVVATDDGTVGANGREVTAAQGVDEGGCKTVRQVGRGDLQFDPEVAII